MHETPGDDPDVVGVEARLGRVSLTVKGVEAELYLRARLDNVARIIERVLDTIDHNPDIVGRLVDQVGTAANQAVGDLTGAAGGAVGDVAGAAAGLAEGRTHRRPGNSSRRHAAPGA